MLKTNPEFTGNLRLNFHKGTLCSVDKSEKIKQ